MDAKKTNNTNDERREVALQDYLARIRREMTNGLSFNDAKRVALENWGVGKLMDPDTLHSTALQAGQIINAEQNGKRTRFNIKSHRTKGEVKKGD